ncbi:MAG: 23S rRNA (guanosine(2251)-2'-O)-methyltransferase RlmB [Woeseiaceae bacterium]|nr:23S rRNA (guanosine(2251)-2'-O)-methyltransferase RlmB [Woeseiaceae bacterium]
MTKPSCVTGLRAVEQLLTAADPPVRRLLAEYQTANPRVQALIRRAEETGIDVQFANRARLRQISGDARHQGVVAEIRRETMLDESGLRTLVENALTGDVTDEPLLLLLLDGVQDPHNLGACLRTADAAGVDAVVVPRRGAAGIGPTVSKVAAGAAESLPFAAVASLSRVLDWLGDYDVRRIATSDTADQNLYEAAVDGPAALVMGSEHDGVSSAVAARCDQLVYLPMRGSVPSLNVSVATGICLFELRRRQARSSAADRATV